MLSSQGVVLATAMVVSSSLLYVVFSKQKTSPDLTNHDLISKPQNLRSCLSSSDKKKKKKKRVQFAKNVKDTKGNGEEYRREKEKALLCKQENAVKEISGNSRIDRRSCRLIEIQGMPANRIALYNGILRDRLQRIECSF